MASYKDKENDKEQPEEIEYPEHQEYIRDIVTPYREKIWQLNDQIDKLDQKQAQEPHKHTMTFNPPGYLRSRVPPAYNRDILVGQREDIQQQLDKRVGVEIKELEPDEKAAVREAVRNDVDRNPFAGKSKEELDKIKEERKDLSLSQNYNMMQLKNYRDQASKKDDHAKVAPIPKEPSAPPAASERFNGSLTYTQAIKNGKDITERDTPTPKRTVDRDDR